ncbi:hypothetical protein A2767_07710 [Candidatus Roizmanbacteria bacterium RIFCSPHIGHO2_01_FULL_35_10]|uniref:Uncharacterized protein n=1 Tax=Candidatus Roizmanbacteria bacterium RIFCSPLOWO2_01_FULL_35_13 TaxID=1802055 RepID=A0A1F7ICS5_9BACT|nr:MAG: hypothetical protein A2767_07710 [Candidatus Roizmanbacteria bacterium RIFCSPHIGHO2_01_FULL_35_10]OGK41152.1 MAG: hypothetical protein A3A74_02305 [Candidatus Roizmanbacteria bacterium RIFCSPLOWO2_01_FULL_35_13]
MKKILKLLTRLTPFDLIIICALLISIIFFFLFFYRKSEYVDIRVKSTDLEVLYGKSQPFVWYANQFEVGDVEKDVLGKNIAEIKSVESFNVTPDKKVLYLDLRLRGLFDSRTKLYSARGKNLIIGTPIKFNFSRVAFEGVIVETPESLKQNKFSTKNVKVTALARGINELQTNVVWGVDELQTIQDYSVIEPEVFQNIHKGDKITDSKKQVLVEIIDLQIRPAQRITQSDAGELLLKDDPYYKDAILTVIIKTKKYRNEYFIFDNQLLKLGEKLPLNFTNLSIFPVITNIDYL